VIQLHRLSHEREPFHLNPDLIERVDATPDCHITLTTGTRVAVMESPEEVVEVVREWRVKLISQGLRQARVPLPV
jgi:flagellar protein FlbD